jgi:hypothetical protein
MIPRRVDNSRPTSSQEIPVASGVNAICQANASTRTNVHLSMAFHATIHLQNTFAASCAASTAFLT